MPAGVAGAVHCVSNIERSKKVDARLTALLQDCLAAIARLSDSAAAPDPASEGACIVMPALVFTMLRKGLDPGVQDVLSGLQDVVTMPHLPGMPQQHIVIRGMVPFPPPSNNCSRVGCWRCHATVIL